MKPKICINTILAFLLAVIWMSVNADTIRTNTKDYGLFDKNGFLVEQPNYAAKGFISNTSATDQFSHFSVKTLVQKADSCIKEGDTKQGMNYLGSAVGRDNSRLSREDKEWKALACSNLGYFLLVDMQDPSQAYYCFEKGIEIAKFLGPSDRISRLACALYSNMGKLFMLFDDVPRTLFYYKKSFDLAINIKDDESVINTYVDLAQSAWLLDAVDSISKENKEFSQYENKNTFPWLNKYVSNLNEAIELTLKGDFDSALDHLDESLENIDTPFSTHRYYTITHLLIAKMSLLTGNDKEAEKSLALADSIIKANNIIDLEDDLNKFQALHAIKIGNDSLAAVKLLKATSIRDSLFNMHEYGKILDMQSNWAIEKYDADANRYKNQRGWMIFTSILIMILTILLVSGTLYWKKNTQKKGLKQRSINTHNSKTEAAISEESKNIYEKVMTYIENDTAVYDINFSIETLASTMGLKVHQISKAINNVTGKNFSTPEWECIHSIGMRLPILQEKAQE